MKTFFIGFVSIIGGLIAIFALGFILNMYGLFTYGFFAPKQEAIRRNVFEQTKSYNQGMIQELQNMQFEYIKADKEHQDALRSIILHRSADYNENNLPSDLYQFVNSLKHEN